MMNFRFPDLNKNPVRKCHGFDRKQVFVPPSLARLQQLFSAKCQAMLLANLASTRKVVQ
jgi:hypothetical protein